MGERVGTDLESAFMQLEKVFALHERGVPARRRVPEIRPDPLIAEHEHHRAHAELLKQREGGRIRVEIAVIERNDHRSAREMRFAAEKKAMCFQALLPVK